MERSRNWPAWIALALASMALFVALSGRSDRHGWHDRDVIFGSAHAERGPDVRFFQDEVRPGIPAAPAAPESDRFMGRGEGFGPRGDMMWRGHHRGPGFFSFLAPLFVAFHSSLASHCWAGCCINGSATAATRPPVAPRQYPTRASSNNRRGRNSGSSCRCCAT
ncbi:hypothetical protein HC891_04055 [Candidatus Gracilibacteria bacterium]|nr:hypothetical protein [Candidatus Gracilibacteria bacterium]